jgi:hypothetical protein
VATDAAPLAGDRCDDALPITLPRGLGTATFVASTTVAHDDYAPGCTAHDELGNDRVYQVTVPAGHRLDAKLSPLAPAMTAALYFLEGPAAACGGACLAGSAGSGPGEQAYASHDNTTGAPQEVFVVVDSLDGDVVEGDYRLAVRLAETPVVAP